MDFDADGMGRGGRNLFHDWMSLELHGWMDRSVVRGFLSCIIESERRGGRRHKSVYLLATPCHEEAYLRTYSSVVI